MVRNDHAGGPESTRQGFSLQVREWKRSISSAGSLKVEEGRSVSPAYVLGTESCRVQALHLYRSFVDFPQRQQIDLKNPLENRKYTALKSHLLPYTEMFCLAVMFCDSVLAQLKTVMDGPMTAGWW